MSTRLLIVLALLAGLLCAALPALTQPPVDDAWLTVTVIKADGTPVKTNIKISFYGENGNQIFTESLVQSAPPPITYTGLKTGDYHLALSVTPDDDFGTQNAEITSLWFDERDISLLPGENTLEWRLPKPATLTIKLTTADGKDLKTLPTIAMFRLPRVTRTSLSVATSAGSMVTLKAILPGTYRIDLGQKAGGPLDSRTVTLGPGANTLDWALPPTVTVTLRLHYADGTLVTDPLVCVRLTRIASSQMSTFNDIRVPADGNMFIDGLSSGDYAALIMGRNGVITNDRFSLKEGDNAVDLTLPALATLTVTLTDSAGTADPIPPPSATGHWNITINGYSQRLNNNTCVFKDLAASTYTVILTADDSGKYGLLSQPGQYGVVSQSIIRRVVTLKPGENSLTWAVPQLCSVTLRVLEADGTPPWFQSNSFLLVKEDDGIRLIGKRIINKDSTEISYPCVPVGTYHKYVSFYSFSEELFDEGEVTLTPGDHSFDWRLPPLVTLSGPVTSNGRPVTPGGGFALLTEGAECNTGFSLDADFKKDRYQLPNTVPDYTALLMLTNIGWAHVPLELSADKKNADIPLDLQQGSDLKVNLTTDIPVNFGVGNLDDSIYLYLTHSNGVADDIHIKFSFTLFPKPVLALPSLPPGRWHYQVEPDLPCGPLQGEFTIVAGQPLTLTLPAPAAGDKP